MFRDGLNKLFMTRTSSDGQVAKALNDLQVGYTDDSPVFGGEPEHNLEGTIAIGQFVLAPMQAATVSSVNVRTETGAEFLQFLSKSHNTPGEDGHDILSRPLFKKNLNKGSLQEELEQRWRLAYLQPRDPLLLVPLLRKMCPPCCNRPSR